MTIDIEKVVARATSLGEIGEDLRMKVDRPRSPQEDAYFELLAALEQLKAEQKQPWLGLATTGELLEELTARAEVDGSINYKTVGETDD